MARTKNQLLADEMAAMDGIDPDQPSDPVVSVSESPINAATPIPVPAQSGLDMATFASALVAAIQQGTAGAIRETKPPPRENDLHPDVSAFNPLGERDHPRPGLKCDMYLAVFDEREPQKMPAPLYPIEADACTLEEQVLLNAIEPWEGTIERNDERKEAIKVVAQRHMTTGALTRLVFAFRRELYEKDSRNQLPGLRRLARQILDQQQPGRAQVLLTALAERKEQVLAPVG